jgi:1-deoxy-D-xylulose-5-phosphate synthase
MDRAGLVGDDGPTHHGAYDISYLRALPNMVLMAPRDEAMLVHMLRSALAYEGPAALRYPRGAGIGVELPGTLQEIEIGTGETLVQGERVALVGYGTGVQVALDAAVLLRKRGIEPTVCDARFAKPLDRELMLSLAAGHELVAVVEENVLAGGFGSAVVEYLADSGALLGGPIVIRAGIPDRFVTHGKPDLLHEEIGFTGERVAERVFGALERASALRSA